MLEFTSDKAIGTTPTVLSPLPPELDASGLASRIVILQAALDQQAQDITHLNRFLERRETFLREGLAVFATFYQTLLDKQDSDSATHASVVADRDAAIARLIDEVAQRDLAITRLDHDRADRDEAITRLHHEVGRRDETIIRLDQERSHCDEEITWLRFTIEDRVSAIMRVIHDHQAADEVTAKSRYEAEQWRSVARNQEDIIRQLQVAASQKDAIISMLSGSMIRLPFSRTMLIAIRWLRNLLLDRG